MAYIPIIDGESVADATTKINVLGTDVDSLNAQSFYQILGATYDVVNNIPNLTTNPLAPNKGMRISGSFAEPFSRFGFDWLPNDIIIRLTDNSGYTKLDNTTEINDAQSSLKTTYSSSKINTELTSKQNTLVSGTNIKTINGSSVLGSGDLQVDHTQLSNIGTNTHGQIDTALTRLANTSNTNTGDETQATIKTKLGVSSAIQDGYLTQTDWNTFNNKQNANTVITADTKTKISYDSKGLVTSGGDATTTDIAEGTNLYYTNARGIGSLLTGFSVLTRIAITSTDSILQAFGIVQKYLNDLSTVAFSGSATDITAGTLPDAQLSTNVIRSDVSSQISAITNKTTLVDADIGIIEDSAATNIKKSFTLLALFNYISSKLSGAISTILTSDLTVSRALISNASGKVDVATTTSAEIDFVNGVTSSIQTQLNGKNTKTSNLSDVANQQTALNNLTNVASATNEYVLTKDTTTGDAIFKASAGGGGGSSVAKDFIVSYKTSGTLTTSISDSGYVGERVLWDSPAVIQNNNSLISYNNSTGVFTLQAGTVYEITTAVCPLYSGTSPAYWFGIYNITTATSLVHGWRTLVNVVTGTSEEVSTTLSAIVKANVSSRIAIAHPGGWGSSQYTPPDNRVFITIKAIGSIV